MTPRAQLPKSKGSAESVTRPVRRVGEGPTPCWVCGRDGHRYGDCPKKKKNVVCGVCGSQAHPPHTCPQRYFPEFRTGNFGAWRNQPRNATYVRSSGNRKAASTTRGENPRLEGDSMRAMSGSTERTSEESGAQALLIRALPSETLLGLAQRISSKCESLPTQDPTHRKLKYYVKIGDHDAVALLDTGATHSFFTPADGEEVETGVAGEAPDVSRLLQQGIHAYPTRGNYVGDDGFPTEAMDFPGARGCSRLGGVGSRHYQGMAPSSRPKELGIVHTSGRQAGRLPGGHSKADPERWAQEVLDVDWAEPVTKHQGFVKPWYRVRGCGRKIPYGRW